MCSRIQEHNTVPAKRNRMMVSSWEKGCQWFERHFAKNQVLKISIECDAISVF